MPEQAALNLQTFRLLIFDWEGTIGACSCGLIENAADSLRQLYAAGFDLAIATSMSTSRLKDLLAEYDLTDLFMQLQTSEMGYPKPDPRMLETILTNTAHTPAESVMIGDSSFDLEMANHADVASIGVLTGRDTADMLATQNPLAILDSIAALPTFISTNNDAKN